jgi:hypothetical protein
VTLPFFKQARGKNSGQTTRQNRVQNTVIFPCYLHGPTKHTTKFMLSCLLWSWLIDRWKCRYVVSSFFVGTVIVSSQCKHWFRTEVQFISAEELQKLTVVFNITRASFSIHELRRNWATSERRQIELHQKFFPVRYNYQVPQRRWVHQKSWCNSNLAFSAFKPLISDLFGPVINQSISSFCACYVIHSL